MGLAVEKDNMNTNKKTTNAWLGHIYALSKYGTQQHQHATIVAVWAKDKDHFDSQLKAHLESNDIQFQYSESAMPALKWLQQNPNNQQSTALARHIHPNDPIAFDPIDKLLANTVASQYFNPMAYLSIEPLGHIEPLGQQQSSFPVKAVPDILHTPLFEQAPPTKTDIEQYGSPDAVPPLKTYAVLCAATVTSLRDIMKQSGLVWQCLFKGERENELKDAAPHLIELKEGNTLTRKLFTHLPTISDDNVTAHLWQKRPGIYIRSRANFDALLQHLRKFHRLENEQGKGYFFRFWDPLTVRMAAYQSDDPASPMTRLCDSRYIHTLHAFSKRANLCVRPNTSLPQANGVVQLRQTDIDVLTNIRKNDFLDDIYTALLTDHPDLYDITTVEEIKDLYVESQQNQYTSAAANWNYIRSTLLLKQRKNQTIDLETVANTVDPNQEYTPTKRAERIWEWTNSHIGKDTVRHDSV